MRVLCLVALLFAACDDTSTNPVVADLAVADLAAATDGARPADLKAGPPDLTPMSDGGGGDDGGTVVSTNDGGGTTCVPACKTGLICCPAGCTKPDPQGYCP